MVLRKQTDKKLCLDFQIVRLQLVLLRFSWFLFERGGMTDTFLLDVLFFSGCAPQLRWGKYTSLLSTTLALGDLF